MHTVLALDLGASGGRALLGSYDGERLRLEEIHRFANEPVFLRGTLYWDVLRLFHEIKTALRKADGRAQSVSVDTWGVDFGLLDEDGNLLENPVHYRDARTQGQIEKALAHMPREALYAENGNQIVEYTSLMQLLALREQRPALLERADSLLFMPDLFHYFLTGNRAAEMSIASTSQLFNPRTKGWSEAVLNAFALPARLLPPLIPGGSLVGELDAALREELEIPPLKVIATAGHDTQCAMIAVPAYEEDFLFISTGTWSLVGSELPGPVINTPTLEKNLNNETGFGGKNALLKNATGLWLLQESRRRWEKEGRKYGYSEIESIAAEAAPLRCFVDPDDPVFTRAGNMPARIRNYCEKTGQYVPQSDGEIARCIYESLALSHARAVAEIVEASGKDFPAVYIVGGGSRSASLCKATAGACNLPVYAGPAEATALGNIAAQLITLGALPDIGAARALIRESESIGRFAPENPEGWREARARFAALP